MRYSPDIRILLLVVTMTIAACTPRFETRHTLTPPTTVGGPACIAQCEAVRGQCEELERSDAETCASATPFDPERCRAQLRESGRKERWYDCLPSACTADLERCEQNFFRCYRSCGGTVTAERSCVEHCGSER
jgi:hypothetical protein